MLSNVTRSQRNFLRKCALVFIISLFLTLVLYSSLDKITDKLNYYFTWFSNHLTRLLLNSGFSINEIVITGNKFTNKKNILDLIDKTQPIIYISLSKLADNIQSVNKWIKYIRIYRNLPNNILHVNIDEYKPFALWKDSNNRTAVIDSEGKVITYDYSINNLIMIEGQNSLSDIKFIKNILESKTQLSKYISACIYVGNRRWNVILNNVSTVKLPENNPNAAWHYLNHLQNTTDFTFNDWSIIDMRIVDKILVKK
ncbi:MAG: cell division protein FtsQ/DivIB [Wolbachia endosymbiont of Meromenopon meropis]|nr:cell division protein FtsQ/DivIB [Wolbachia endosymbiont of Meromenopon meropis]